MANKRLSQAVLGAAISLPFVWLTVCEKKGKTLEQMKDTTELEPRTNQ